MTQPAGALDERRVALAEDGGDAPVERRAERLERPRLLDQGDEQGGDRHQDDDPARQGQHEPAVEPAPDAFGMPRHAPHQRHVEQRQQRCAESAQLVSPCPGAGYRALSCRHVGSARRAAGRAADLPRAVLRPCVDRRRPRAVAGRGGARRRPGRPGAAVRLRLLDSVVEGKVVAVDAPQHVSFSWDYPDAPLAAPTVVAFDAIDHGARSHVTIRHVGFRSRRQVDLHDALWRYWFGRLREAARRGLTSLRVSCRAAPPPRSPPSSAGPGGRPRPPSSRRGGCRRRSRRGPGPRPSRRRRRG